MAEHAAQKELDSAAAAARRAQYPEGPLLQDDAAPEHANVLTGGDDPNRQLLPQLQACIHEAQGIDIIVSFLMESGAKLIVQDLKEALERGAAVRILTGNYLGITQPSALYLLKHELGERADLRFYSERDRSFHAKSYIFHLAGREEIFVGSSNVSKSALTSGIEWNYRLSSQIDPLSCAQFERTFLDLFENHSLRIDDKVLAAYSKSWHQPAVVRDVERLDAETEKAIEPDARETDQPEPRGAQIEALCALEDVRAEGAEKALVQAATGVGKTYLAAFDSKGCRTVLFVAHRREILQQAAESFRRVRGSDAYGFFDGDEKCTDEPVIFASVQTLGNERYLNERYFSPDRFEYLVVDEFHHAVARQYQRIVNYFKPRFMLGLTATPERMDGRSIYEICDYNVAYEVPLKDAINKGMLAPFRYFGIYDSTDYTKARRSGGKYVEEDLDKIYLGNAHRNELVVRHYRKHGSGRALGFCSSRAHAAEMARVFRSNGIPAAAVVSGGVGRYCMDRGEAIRGLEAGELRVIFSVDMFNEGVDIPDVDMVMFLRPTESPVVFLQQLGRGLRLAPGKEYLTVLDFIGNYEKAGQVRYLLTGTNDVYLAARNGTVPQADAALALDYPDGCQVDFDLELIDLFDQMERNRAPAKDRIRREFLRVEELLEQRPSRMDLFTCMDDEVYELCRSQTSLNIFSNYLGFLNEMDQLTPDEQRLYNGIGREFLHVLETTSMTKVYKMPVLRAFYNGGDVRMQVTDEQLLASWKGFFGTGTNWKDLPQVKTREDYLRITDKGHLQNIKKNPVTYLQKSGKGFFVKKPGCTLALADELEPVIHDPAFAEQMGDIIDYRTMNYYQNRYHEQASVGSGSDAIALEYSSYI